MNKTTRLLLLLLTIVLLCGSLFAFAGCKKDDKEEGGNNGGGGTQAAGDGYRDDLPADLKFDNPEIRVLIGEPSAGHGGTFSERSIGIEGYTIGDPGTNTVDEQVYYRNLAIEERLNVVILPTVVNGGIIQSTMLTALRSGESEFDIISGYQAHDVSMAVEGLLLNLNKLDQVNAPYVDLTKEYWSEMYHKALTYKGATYYATGDLSLRYLGGMYCTFVNTSIYSNILAETYGNIYTLVDSKGWNMEVMQQMITQVYDDTGAEGDVIDPTDRLGFVTEPIDMIDGMAIGAGVVWGNTDMNGNIQVALTNGDYNASAFTFIETISDMLTNNNTGSYLFTTHSHSANSMGAFVNGNVLFTCDKVYQAENYLTDMEHYGIIPMPMLNAAQGEYRTGIHDGCSLYGLYVHSDNIPAAAATLEALASMGDKIATAYYDEALKYRYSRDPDSARMIDLIRDTVYIDFVFLWGNEINDIHNFFREYVSADSVSKNVFNKNKTVWNTKLELLLTALESQSGVIPTE